MDQNGQVPPDARQWASICHVVALAGLLGNGVGFVLGPLIVWVIKKQEHPFIDEAGREAVNFQLTMFIAALLSVPLAFVGIGFILLIVVGVLMVVLPIIAGLKVNEGIHYRYPFSIRFIN
ncbi:MAG TPA: DUF4870 domain-containing protein [Candidatus Krumholzibacterium sp.]|nr:DUF4870 domain-containing protein [Candidatus Krumholzibacterium sp.]